MSWSDVPTGGSPRPGDAGGTDPSGAPAWASGPVSRPAPPPTDAPAAAPPWAASADNWPVADPGAGRPPFPGADRGWAGAPASPAWANTPSGAPAARTDAGPVVQTGPPTAWLWVAAVVPVVAAVLFLLAGPVENAVGWAVAAFGSVAALAVFQSKDVQRRASSWYATNDTVIAPLRLAVVVLGLGVAAGHAYFFADWLARSDVFA